MPKAVHMLRKDPEKALHPHLSLTLKLYEDVRNKKELYIGWLTVKVVPKHTHAHTHTHIHTHTSCSKTGKLLGLRHLRKSLSYP